uniref:Putative ovule protein n=1 Tax=Solanum chacoense TaxID=4108 RepID=A0A0V0H1Q5_SOLCH
MVQFILSKVLLLGHIKQETNRCSKYCSFSGGLLMFWGIIFRDVSCSLLYYRIFISSRVGVVQMLNPITS